MIPAFNTLELIQQKTVYWQIYDIFLPESLFSGKLRKKHFKLSSAETFYPECWVFTVLMYFVSDKCRKPTGLKYHDIASYLTLDIVILFSGDIQLYKAWPDMISSHDNSFIPEFLKWTLPSLNLVRTIVPNRNLSQKSKYNCSVDPDETAHSGSTLPA